uniref:RSN1_7TM domain-containing protein n=1 Tax=Echinostoma caproni TaxID=27848 RepID=A0A183B137_9TREM
LLPDVLVYLQIYAAIPMGSLINIYKIYGRCYYKIPHDICELAMMESNKTVSCSFPLWLNETFLHLYNTISTIQQFVSNIHSEFTHYITCELFRALRFFLSGYKKANEMAKAYARTEGIGMSAKPADHCFFRRLGGLVVQTRRKLERENAVPGRRPQLKDVFY